jgi:hypothetical protein
VAKIKIIAKGGVYLILNKGRLADASQVENNLKDLLNAVTAGDTVEFDATAVAVMKRELGGI